MHCALISALISASCLTASASDHWLHNVVRALTHGFYCSHWGGSDYLTIDGAADSLATSLHVPGSVDWHGNTYRVAELGPSAFQGMKHLQRCSFDTYWLLIHAFSDCPALRVLESRNAVPPLVGQHMYYYGAPDEVFDDYHFLTCAVVVPPGSEQAYREAHGWREFHTIVSHEPRRDDYDLTAIAAAIAALEHERDSLSACERTIADSLKALATSVAAVAPTAPGGNATAATARITRTATATRPPDVEMQSVEHTSSKILSGGYVYKSRFSPEIIITAHSDTTALHLAVPDSLDINGRRYPVTQMWEDAFACHGHLLTLTLPAHLANVAPGAFAGCGELRLLELRSAVPPSFRSIDNGACQPHDVLDSDLCHRLTLVVPPGSEQAYREAPGWSRCARITSARPTLAELGIGPADEQRVALDAHLCRIAARQQHIATALQALHAALR